MYIYLHISRVIKLTNRVIEMKNDYNKTVITIIHKYWIYFLMIFHNKLLVLSND